MIVLAQVRRMTGALVAVGQGKLSIRQLQELLDTRDSMAYPQNIMAPAHGLFLTNVEYKDTGNVRHDLRLHDKTLLETPSMTQITITSQTQYQLPSINNHQIFIMRHI